MPAPQSEAELAQKASAVPVPDMSEALRQLIRDLPPGAPETLEIVPMLKRIFG